MKQTAAAPSQTAEPHVGEVTIMAVWPSVARNWWCRWWGRLYQIRLGIRPYGVPLTLGGLLALISIPFTLPVYIHMRVPRLPFVFFGWTNWSCLRYRLTNRRVIVEHPFGGGEHRSVSLDRFDHIEIDVLPGQEWFPAGDLVFFHGATETFRLQGVRRPEPFRQTCLKAHQSLVGIQNSLAGR